MFFSSFLATLYPYDNGTELNCHGNLGISLSQIVRLDVEIQVFCQQFSSLYVSLITNLLNVQLKKSNMMQVTKQVTWTTVTIKMSVSSGTIWQATWMHFGGTLCHYPDMLVGLRSKQIQ